jgi:coenzyme F420 biosynthesis associated uncharacterized protein
MADPVDWDVARSVARRFAQRQPFATTFYSEQLESDFERFTAQAEQLVGEETGLWSLSGNARARLTDRDGWIDANVASYQRMLKPLLDKVGDRLSTGRLAPIGSRIAGAELGFMLGWMSGRVLGQYDMLIVEDQDVDDQDIVYHVGPNVVALERKFAFRPEEFRLWLSLHEVTHRAQFTGVPWLREYFLSLVSEIMESVDPDPDRFAEALRRFASARREGIDPMDEGGVSGLLATEEQRVVMEKIGGLMSLLEGHGDTTMDRAGADLIPGAERFGKVLRARRSNSRGFVKLLQRLIGLEAKIKQYEQGEAFIEAVEGAGGEALINRVWEGPENLPSIHEIREPDTWIERLNAVPAVQ